MQNNAISEVVRRNFREYKIQKLGNIKNYEQNSRTHSEEQIAEVVRSIKEFGFTAPILVDECGEIIAGHCRVSAAQRIGMEEIPTIIIEGLTPVQKAALVIADNKLALNAGWDFTKLAEQITFLKDNDYDIDLTGFKPDELATFMPDALPEFEGDEDDVPEPPAEPITKLGDVYLLGGHRLMCGDSTILEDIDLLINGEKADMVFTDPPYGVSINTHRNVQGANNLAIKAKYDPIIGDDSPQTAIDAYNLCEALKIPVLIFWGANYYANALPPSSCWLIWDKENSGNFADAELAWTNQKTAVRIFRYMWNGMIRKGEPEKRIHPTQKPIALAEWVFDEYAPESKNILDLFGGSGSTLIACEKTQRKCFMMELSPRYCDVIVARWEKFTGKKAILENRDDSLPNT